MLSKGLLFSNVTDEKNLSLLCEDLCQDWHGQGHNGGEKVGTALRVSVLSVLATEAVSLEVLNTLGNGQTCMRQSFVRTS